ncbi:MAG TPA: hypothetical protein VGK73_07095 [Polyangiaceae bacterium]
MKRSFARVLLLGFLHAPTALAQETTAPPSPPEQPAQPPAETPPAETPPSEAPAVPPPEPSVPAEPPGEPPPAPAPSPSAGAPPAPPPSASFEAAPPAATTPKTAPPTAPPAPVAGASSAPALQDPPKKQDDEDLTKRDDQNGVLGPVRIGPMIGTGLPGLLAFGGMLKLTRYFAAGVDVGIIPNLAFSFYGDASVAYQGYDVYGRIHPFGNSFYFGAAIGYAHMTATYQDTQEVPPQYASLFPELGSSVTYTSEATMRTLVLSPSLGFFHIFKSGFSLGIGAGLQIPVAPSELEYNSRTDPNLPDAIEDQLLGPTDQIVTDTLESVGQTPIPRFELRMGWML